MKGHKKGTYEAVDRHERHMCDYYVKGPPLHLMNHVLLPALFKYKFEVLSCASYIMQYTEFGNYLLVALP